MNLVVRNFTLILCLLHGAYATPQFLVITDIHYGSNYKSEDSQDTGPAFLKITLNKFQELAQHVDFIITLGDFPAHALFNIPEKEEYEKTVFHGLYINDTQLKPMFYIPGNNDSLLGNYQPFASKGISPLNLAAEWDSACAHCNALIIDDASMHSGGYYSSYVMPNNKEIILIALNATQWTRPPLFFQYPKQDKDATAQLSWLDGQLKKNHAKQLLIAMHEPPGVSYKGKPIWQQQYLQRFIKILAKHHQSYGQITLLGAHTHMDEIRKIHLDLTTNIYVYSTPSISRKHYNNPGMKVFYLDKKMQIKDYTTYYTTHLNQWKNQEYHATSYPDAIFPNCRHKSLAACLNGLSDQQVCHYLDRGLYYGVKSPYVPNNLCSKTYRIN